MSLSELIALSGRAPQVDPREAQAIALEMYGVAASGGNPVIDALATVLCSEGI